MTTKSNSELQAKSKGFKSLPGWHHLGFHKYKNVYRTYSTDLQQYEFRYCMCGKWKRNRNPLDEAYYPELAAHYARDKVTEIKSFPGQRVQEYLDKHGELPQ